MADTWTDYGVRRVMNYALVNDATRPTAMSVRLLDDLTTSMPNHEELEDWSVIQANEVASGNGYATGGESITIATTGNDWTIAEGGVDGQQGATLANKQWTASGSGITALGAALVATEGGTDKVWAIWDFGGSVTVTAGGTLTLTGCELRITT